MTDAEAPAGRILVIEDEPGIRDFLEQGLGDLGFAVTVAADGQSGIQLAITEDVDLVVLDLMLPDAQGLDLLTEIRSVKRQLPVIVLTALGETADRIAGLDAGATDYVVKPFSVGELAARIRAQLRTLDEAQSTRLSAAGVDLDLISRRVTFAEREIHLSATEFQLLAYLVQNAGRVLSRDQILRAVWGYEHDPGTNGVEVYIGYLRRKLRQGDTELPLVTIRSVGYRLGHAS